ncbi:MAG: 3-isopropylmalate dehydratase small subunit [Longimicrobiales bacterium]
MEPIETLVARVVVLTLDDIDTDQIIPARFLTVTGKSRLEDALFADWRSEPSFPLNQPAAQGAQILLAGRNFGCGSSREHAVWALQSYGFRAVISTAFADIFRSNALGNGLLPIELSGSAYAQVLRLCTSDPSIRLRIDLQYQSVTTPSGLRFDFPIDPFAKHCLLNGIDALGYLRSAEAEIASYEANHAR